jgi:signal transduction histidine kinase
MNSLSRALLLSAALVIVFLLAAVSLQAWLNRQSRSWRAEAEADLAARLAAGRSLLPEATEEWTDEHLQQLSRALGASVTLGSGAVEVAADANVVRSVKPVAPGTSLVATTSISGPLRAETMQSRAIAAITMLAIVLGAVPFILAIANWRRSERETRPPWQEARAEAAGLERFARLTVERGAALVREQGARQRAEEDLQLSRTLLDRSLEERVRLGRELHDNICQTLYAVTLTLESVRKNMSAPPPFEQRLDQCMAELRRLNQSVRAYLRELEPAGVNATPLHTAIAEAIAAIASPHGVEVDQRLDEEVLRLLPAAHASEIVNVVREAASNAVRHGRARRLTVRAARGDGEVALAVADDGVGFEARSRSITGHGLSNMEARAVAIGGQLKIDSAPGKGTRVLLTLPIDSRT